MDAERRVGRLVAAPLKGVNDLAEVHQAGKEVDAYCTKCKLDLAATVVAAVKGVAVQVECNTCHTVRRYRAPKSAPQPKRASQRKTASKEAATSRARPRVQTMSHEDMWRQALKGRSVDDAVRYNIREKYQPDAVLAHSKFGIGVVTAEAPPDRITVQFRDAERTLISGYSR